jgi:hypothetical protein
LNRGLWGTVACFRSTQDAWTDRDRQRSYWWNELLSSTVWQAVVNLFPPGSTVRGAGVAVTGSETHMNVFTTPATSNGLLVQVFNEVNGWASSAVSQGAVGTMFPPGAPMHAVALYRDRFDVFALEPGGEVDWQAYSTQFQYLPSDCTATWDCSTSQVL